jgi:hypothetical protein
LPLTLATRRTDGQPDRLAGRVQRLAQPIVFCPSRASRRMSAWPACWAVSATMCMKTRRAERWAFGGNQGATGSG